MSKVVICKIEDLEEKMPTRIDKGENRFAVVKISDTEVKVIDDECTHADFSLSEGEYDEDENTLECPKHGSCFSLEDGQPSCLPATKPVIVYEAEIVENEVMVTINE